MSTADRAKLDRQYRAAQAQKRYSSPTPKPKRLESPVSTKIDKPNVLARAYDALLNVPTVAPAGIGNPSKANNPLNQIVEPVRVAGRRAVGDITAIPRVGKPSASPTATDIKQGNYLGPALDYANLALTAVPAARGVRNRNIYGVHSSPVSDLDVINPRAMNQAQSTASDAVQGSSYMWDAKSPYVGKGPTSTEPASMLKNWQMRLSNVDEFGTPVTPNTLYLTKAPRRNVIPDANVPDSASLRVMGPQTVVGKLPIEQEALRAALRSYGLNPRSQLAQNMIQRFRTSSPRFLTSVAARPIDRAEASLRKAIELSPQKSAAKTANDAAVTSRSRTRPSLNLAKTIYEELAPLNLDPTTPLQELLQNPTVRKIFDGFINMEMGR
jgi:hypothetical protein